jgi:hypothetical protein
MACRTSWRRETLPGSGVDGWAASCAAAVKPPARSATAKHPQLGQQLEMDRVLIENFFLKISHHLEIANTAK